MMAESWPLGDVFPQRRQRPLDHIADVGKAARMKNSPCPLAKARLK